MTRIAVDAMGGDYAPGEIVKGAVWAAQDYNVPIELVGQIDKIQEVLDEIAKKGIRSNRGGYFVKNRWERNPASCYGAQQSIQ